jgi:hypothetical protein
MEILAQPGGRPKPTPVLAERLERQVFAPARSIGEALSLVAITKPPPPVSIMHPPQGGTWVAAYHDTDPVAQGRGGYLHAPEDEIERMTRLFDAGVEPEVILIGHQLPGHWRPGDPVPAAYLPGESSTASRVLAAQAGAVEVGLGLLRAAAKVGTGIGVAAIGAATVGAATFAGAGIGALALLDPFVVAGVREPQNGLIGWVPLGGWHEEPAR